MHTTQLSRLAWVLNIGSDEPPKTITSKAGAERILGGEARLVKAVARGVCAAAGRPPGLERDLLRLEVMLGMCESRPHDVIRAGSRAYELQVDSTDPWERWASASMANNVGQSYVYLEDHEQAKKFAAKVKELDIEDPRALAMVEQILNS